MQNEGFEQDNNQKRKQSLNADFGFSVHMLGIVFFVCFIMYDTRQK